MVFLSDRLQHFCAKVNESKFNRVDNAHWEDRDSYYSVHEIVPDIFISVINISKNAQPARVLAENLDISVSTEYCNSVGEIIRESPSHTGWHV
jgi:hypothetical protein